MPLFVTNYSVMDFTVVLTPCRQDCFIITPSGTMRILPSQP